MQSGRQCNLEERYAIKFCFQLGKNAAHTYGILQTDFRSFCMNQASVFEWHKRFKEGRESVRDDKRCWRSKEVNRPELIDQKVRFRIIMSEETSTPQIGSVAFQPGQCTSPKLHLCHRLFDQDGYQDSSLL